MAILLFGALGGFGGISSGSLISTVAYSSSCSGVVGSFFFRLLDHFPIDGPGRFGLNLTSGMNGICSTSLATMAYGGTYMTVSSIMSVGDAVTIPDYATVLVLEMEITILCGKNTLDLVVVEGNLSLECSRMN